MRNLMAVSRLGQFRSLVKEAWNGAFMVAKFFCCLHVTNTYVCTVALAFGPSMLPTIGLTSELLLVEKLSLRFENVGRGDIVLIRSPQNPRKIITKRLVAMEGDSVKYMVDPKNSDRCETVMVPKGHIWVQGDNMYESVDSRHFGSVPYGLIQGKAFWRIWPPKVFGSLGKQS